MTPVSDDGDGSDMTEAGSTFLERWSRRKRQQKSAPGLDSAATPGIASQDVAADIGQEAPEGRAEPELPLPSLDDLTVDGDVTAFLEKRVPEELRRLAMRKMWSLDPQIRDFVEMAENQYDWNTAGGVPGYGDLNPGFDLEALLAQATGQGATKPEEPTTTAAQSPAKADHEARATAEFGRSQDGLSNDPSGMPYASLDTVTATAQPGDLTAATEETSRRVSSQNCELGDEFVGSAKQPTEHHAATNGYRRHGSALPI